MRIHRLEFGISIGPMSWGAYEGRCFCRLIDIGPFYVTWLSYECLSGIYDDKARRYRIKRYLKERKQRAT
jgi:hypothetical protein